MLKKLPPLWIQILVAMALGVAVGLPLNLLTGTVKTWETTAGSEWTSPKEVWKTEKQKHLRLAVRNDGEATAEVRILGRSSKEAELEVLETRDVPTGETVQIQLDRPEQAISFEARSAVFLEETQLTIRGVSGTLDRANVLRIAGFGKWMGDIFLSLLKMIVVPLIFASLVTSILGMGGQKGFARLGLRTATYYVCTSLLAIVVGLLVVNLIRPGEGLDYSSLMSEAMGELSTHGKSLPANLQADSNTLDVLLGIFSRMIPENVISAASVNRELLAVIFFALVFGFAGIKVGGEHAEFLGKAFRAVEATMTRLTHGILYIAPIGIFGFIVFVTAATGLSLAASLGKYMITVFAALCIHALFTLPIILKVLGKRSPTEYARALAEALSTAFSTASSAATLPLTMRCVTERAKVPERVTSFTLPLGATVNMDGTALYEAVAVLFIAQMLGDLTIGQQVVVVVTALLASIGAAGIPHAGTVMMVIVLQAVGLPTDAVLLILAVDRVLDMCRTTVNVWSDSVGAAVIARFEPDAEPPSERAEPEPATA